MRVSEPLDYLPLWAVFTATVVLVLVAAEAGFLLGRRNRQRSGEAQKAPVGEIVAALLGLNLLRMHCAHSVRTRSVVVSALSQFSAGSALACGKAPGNALVSALALVCLSLKAWILLRDGIGCADTFLAGSRRNGFS